MQAILTGLQARCQFLFSFFIMSDGARYKKVRIGTGWPVGVTKIFLLFLLISLTEFTCSADSAVLTDLSIPQDSQRNWTKRVAITGPLNNKNIYSTIEENAVKRTVDTPDTLPVTPDMNVPTPDTPETPDTKTKIPDTKDTSESSGFEFLGSGDSSGYSEIESGTFQPLRFVSNYMSNVTDKTGNFTVQWKPYNKNTSKIRITGSDIDTEMTPKDEPKDAENKDMIAEEIHTTLENQKPKPKNESVDRTMLDYFFDRYVKKSDITSETKGQGKRISPKKSHFHKAIQNSVKASKKQDMLFDENPNTISEGPVGKVMGQGGIEGLGGDMHGYPTGMGAGAEPLGAFDNESPSLIQNGGPQSVDDKSDSFGGDFPSTSGSRSPNQMNFPVAPNGFSPIPTGPDFSKQFNGVVSAEPFPGSDAPPASLVSMSNRLENMDDKVNIQGDGEIGNMILNQKFNRNNVREELPAPEVPKEYEDDETMTGEEHENESEPFGLATNDESFSNQEILGKRRLDKRRLAKQKLKIKNKWAAEPFKKLQHHKRHF